MAVIKTKHYEFDMSMLERVRSWQFDALDDILYELETKVLEWTKLLDKGKPYYASIDPCVTEEGFKNLLNVAFEKIGYYKANCLSYEFEMGKHKRIATITLKEKKETIKTFVSDYWQVSFNDEGRGKVLIRKQLTTDITILYNPEDKETPWLKDNGVASGSHNISGLGLTKYELERLHEALEAVGKQDLMDKEIVFV